MAQQQLGPAPKQAFQPVLSIRLVFASIHQEASARHSWQHEPPFAVPNTIYYLAYTSRHLRRLRSPPGRLHPPIQSLPSPARASARLPASSACRRPRRTALDRFVSDPGCFAPPVIILAEHQHYVPGRSRQRLFKVVGPYIAQSDEGST